MSKGLYYVVNMFNLRPTAPLVEMSLKYTILEFTFLKKLTFPRGGGEGGIHINLVDYEMCKYCNVPETVEHYLIDCNCPGQKKKTLELNPCNTNYNACRNILKYKLKKIDSFFKNRCNFNVVNLLFPHIWQVKPLRKDKNYKIKITNGINRRIYIFREIIEFVRRTKRFDREKFGI